MTAEGLQFPATKMEVTEVEIASIRTRFRIRTPDEQKIEEIASSIRICGLINPITIDSEYFLLAGFHRLESYKLLGYKTIPAVIKDAEKLRGELVEIEENISRNELDHLEICEHMARREEILSLLGMRMENGGNQYTEGKITTKQLAEALGMSDRVYRLKRQPIKIAEEVRDLLKGSPFARNQMDMVKLSQQEEKVQHRICRLLISGKCRTFKRALAQSLLDDWKTTKEVTADFSIKERWGIPQSIMRFKKADIHLQKLVQSINSTDEVAVKKRDIHFGTNEVPNYVMMADHSEFLVTYFTKENDLILDNFMGRGTNILAGLYHNRRVVGIDVNKKNVDVVSSVCKKHFPESQENFQILNSCGVELTEWASEQEVFDAVITDPPYVCKAEQYGSDSRDIINLSHTEYMEKIETCFMNLARLIKYSDYEEKVFHPIIFKVGSGRIGSGGLVDMDFEFQQIARRHNLTLWDKVFNELHNVWGNLCAQRNYDNCYVNKNFETNIVFCKFRST
jgi:ParB family chromosome partitioning protein